MLRDGEWARARSSRVHRRMQRLCTCLVSRRGKLPGNKTTHAAPAPPPSPSPFSPSGPLSVFAPLLPPPCPAHSSSASHHCDPVVQARARARPRSPAMQALERAMQNRTVIIIAHRLSTGSTGARADPSGESKGRCRLAPAASKRPRGRHHRPPPQHFHVRRRSHGEAGG